VIAMMREDWLVVLGLALGAIGMFVLGWWLSRTPKPRRPGMYRRDWP
jgi:uncharacterized membrane protein YedE/YeeE